MSATKTETTFSLRPLIRGSLTDVVPIFEAYARDLARACEG